MRIEITTSCCGTTFSAPERYQQYVNTGTTFDCPECGELQVMQGVVTAFASKNFNQWMHDNAVVRGDEFVWPADGKNTGYVEVGE